MAVLRGSSITCEAFIPDVIRGVGLDRRLAL
jgi:hypothetical protein